MKRALTVFFLFPFLGAAQSQLNTTLLFSVDVDSTIIGTSLYNNAYNEVWA